MGCDGGTIPKRDELVRKKKKPEQKDKNAEMAYRWGHCAITQQPLQKPIVACQLGRLYSKESVLEALLDKSNMPNSALHIKSLKDVKEVNLTNNPTYKPKPKSSETYDESLTAPFICPVTGLEMNGKFRFVLFWSCGCTVSERAFKEVKATTCHKCQQPVCDEDVIVLNGDDSDVITAKAKMIARKATVKKIKKSSEVSKTDDHPGAFSDQAGCSKSSDNLQSNNLNGPIKEEKNGNCDGVLSNSISDKAGCSKSTDKLASKRIGSSISLSDPQFKKTKTDYSVSKDPNASDVYKSLFTSHESAAKQTKAHWVTYNPFYN